MRSLPKEEYLLCRFFPYSWCWCVWSEVFQCGKWRECHLCRAISVREQGAKGKKQKWGNCLNCETDTVNCWQWKAQLTVSWSQVELHNSMMPFNLIHKHRHWEAQTKADNRSTVIPFISLIRKTLRWQSISTTAADNACERVEEAPANCIALGLCTTSLTL